MRLERPNLAWLALLVLSVSLGACDSAASPSSSLGSSPSGPPTSSPEVGDEPSSTPLPTIPVKIGHIPVTAYAPVFIALEKGYYRDAGLDVELVPILNSAESVPLVSTGQVQATGVSYGAGLFNALSEGVELVLAAPLIGSAREGQTATPIVARKMLVDDGTISSVTELAGHRVGVLGVGGGAEYLLGLSLEKAGASLDDVELVVLSLPDTIAALQNAAIDAAWLPEPLVTQLESQDVVARIDTAYDFGEEQIAFVLSPDFVANQRPYAVGLIRAHLRAARDLAEDGWDDPENAAIIGQYTNTPPEVIASVPSLHVDPNGEINFESVAAQQAFHMARGHLGYDEPLDLESLFDASLVIDAIAAIGRYTP